MLFTCSKTWYQFPITSVHNIVSTKCPAHAVRSQREINVPQLSCHGQIEEIIRQHRVLLSVSQNLLLKYSWSLLQFLSPTLSSTRHPTASKQQLEHKHYCLFIYLQINVVMTALAVLPRWPALRMLSAWCTQAQRRDDCSDQHMAQSDTQKWR